MFSSDQQEPVPYRISFDYRPEYLFVYVSGETDTLEISRRYWRQIADECSGSKVKKVLIEEDFPEAISMNEMYQLASEIPTMGFYGIRMAFVDSHLDQQHLNEFGELVANNRGIFGRIFSNRAAAEKWLLSA